MGGGESRDHDHIVGVLASYLRLNDEAILVAEGWSILPPRLQRHVKLLIDEYIATQAPVLKGLYAASSHHDQLRFNQIVEAAQRRLRGMPPADLEN